MCRRSRPPWGEPLSDPSRKHSARRQPSIPTVENPRAPGRRSIGRSRCNRGVATAHARHDRTPLERLVATTSPRGPRSTGIGRRSEVPRASRRRPPNRGPKASTGRSKGVPRLQTAASGRDTRQPPPKRRPADDTPVNTGLSTRGRSRRRRFPPRSPKAPRHPPPASGAAAAHRTLQRDPSGESPYGSCVTPDPRPRGSENPMSPPNPRHLVQRTGGCPPCRHGRRHTTHTARHRRGCPATRHARAATEAAAVTRRIVERAPAR